MNDTALRRYNEARTHAAFAALDHNDKRTLAEAALHRHDTRHYALIDVCSSNDRTYALGLDLDRCTYATFLLCPVKADAARFLSDATTTENGHYGLTQGEGFQDLRDRAGVK